MEQMKISAAVSVTTNIWTSKQMEVYMTVLFQMTEVICFRNRVEIRTTERIA